jgi:hypothetical protein
MAFVYFGAVIPKKLNRLIGSSTKTMLVIKNRMCHPEAGSWQQELKQRVE